jgi:GxxExxY protein
MPSDADRFLLPRPSHPPGAPNPLQDLAYKVTGCAITVLNAIGPGLDLAIYRKALLMELTKQGLEAETDVEVRITYDGKLLGKAELGVVVAKQLLVDLRSHEHFQDTDFSENLALLKASQLPMVLMLNFRFGKLQWKKIVFDPTR